MGRQGLQDPSLTHTPVSSEDGGLRRTRRLTRSPWAGSGLRGEALGTPLRSQLRAGPLNLCRPPVPSSKAAGGTSALLSASGAGEPPEGRRPLGTFPRDVALQLDAASLSATSLLGVVSQGGPRAPGEPGVGHLGVWAWDSPQPPNTCPGVTASTTGRCQGCHTPPRGAGPDERSTVELRLGGPGVPRHLRT